MRADLIYVVSGFVVLAAALLPGVATLRFLRYEPASKIEFFAVAPVVGISVSGASVLVLLALGVYTWPTATLILILPLAYLVATRRNREDEDSQSRPENDYPTTALSVADKVALAMAGVLILISLLDASTSPPTWWDGYITWDKWAMDWAGRHHLYGYLQVYPQLYPMFGSLVYKMTGTFGDVLPASSFALHAVHPALAVAAVVALIQISRLLVVPVWPLVLVLFGLSTFRAQLTSGAVDVIVTTFVLVATAVGLRLVSQETAPRRGNWAVLSILLYGAAAVKTTGFIAAAVVAGFLVVSLRHRAYPDAKKRLLTGALWILVIPALANVPFYAVETGTERLLSVEQQDSRELNFSFDHVSWAWSKGRSAKHGSTFDPRATALEILGDYSVPERVRVPLSLVGMLLLLAGLRAMRTWAVAVPVLLYVFAWAELFSYDFRNLLPMIPFLGLWLCLGGVAMKNAVTAHGGWVTRAAGAPLSVAIVVAALGPGCLLYLRSEWAQVGGSRGLVGRLESLSGSAVDRIRVFFPDQYPYYLLLERSGLARSAHQVVAGTHLYRWFPNGRYPWARFSWGVLQRGDVFVGVPPTSPPSPGRWLSIHEGSLRVQVFDPGLRDVLLTSATPTGGDQATVMGIAEGSRFVTPSDERNLFAYAIPITHVEGGSRVFWEADFTRSEKGESVSGFYLCNDSSAIDGDASTTATTLSGAGISKYSGMVTIRPRPRQPVHKEEELLIGLRSDVTGARCQLARFRLGVVAP